LDLVTNEKGKVPDDFGDFSVYWWTEGNGACDCNRCIALGKEDEMDEQMRLQNPLLEAHQSYCYGCKRFVAIDVEGDFEGSTKAQLIGAMNAGYPIEARMLAANETVGD